jgi:hypothetical protein
MGLGSIVSSIADTVRSAADASLASGQITEAEHAALTGSLLHPAIDEINATLGDAIEKLNLNVQDIVEPLMESLTEATEPLQPASEAAAEAAAGAEAVAAEAPAEADAAGFAGSRAEAAMEAVRTLQDENPGAFDNLGGAVGEQAASATAEPLAEATADGGGGGMLGGLSEVLGRVSEITGNLADGALGEMVEPMLEQVQGVLDNLTESGLGDLIEPITQQMEAGTTAVSDVVDIDVAEGEMDDVVVEAVTDRQAEANEIERLQQQAAQLLNQAQAMASQLTEDNTSTNGDDAGDSGSTTDEAEADDAPEPADAPDPEETETETADPDPTELTE